MLFFHNVVYVERVNFFLIGIRLLDYVISLFGLNISNSNLTVKSSTYSDENIQ